MKNSITIFVLFLIIQTHTCFSNNSVKKVSTEYSKETPKGKDLRNHFGHETLNSPYAESEPFQENSLHHYIKENVKDMIPIKDKESLIDEAVENLKVSYGRGKDQEAKITSGKITNISNSAKSLKNPIIAPPTLHVKTEFMYPKIVEYGEFKGYKNKVKKVDVLDKGRNLITKQEVLISEPQYERSREIAEVPTKHHLRFDLSEGDYEHKFPFGQEESKETYGDQFEKRQKGVSNSSGKNLKNVVKK
mmetsp:Transcript_30455/g.31697  ORF Transcript_30455/g.31697 Transcript_30455/m.31697 type:complete len:247 (+) Transcript_30455:11-751(+)